jgi:[acyl-carrier-protein] S-malonyltransferase
MFCLMFTGQGSQKLMMGKDFFDNSSEAKEIMRASEESLKQGISKIIFADTPDELNNTVNTQPAIMINAMMIYKVLLEHWKNFEAKISSFAGHSVGEYNALCANGVFDINAGIKLLRKRAIFMENSCPSNSGGMAALIKTSKENVEELLQNERLEGLICEVANDNGGGQVVISGDIRAVDIVCDLAKDKNIRAIKLKVSGPFHSSLMTKASEQMQEELNNYKFNVLDLTSKVISNVTASEFPADEAEIKKLLVKQIISPVRWRQTMRNIYNSGIKYFLEIGPAPILSGLLRGELPQAIDINFISNIKELELFLEKFREVV